MAATREGGRLALQLDLAGLRDGEAGPLVSLGDSVAVNGVCLTVAALQGDRARFDVVPETLDCTALGAIRVTDAVNVERAMRYGQRVDGHLVQGHVERTGTVDALVERSGELRLGVRCGTEFALRCLPKGSLAIDGVSLTVAELLEDRFVVALVPHTLERTNLGARQLGDQVNLEPDMLGQWVLRLLQGAGALPGR